MKKSRTISAMMAAAFMTGMGFAAQPVMAADFTTAITGNAAADTEYVNGGVTTDGKIYDFKEDSSIDTTATPGAAITLKDGMTIKGDGTTLNVKAKGEAADASAVWWNQAGTANINLGTLHIQEEGTANTNGIRAEAYRYKPDPDKWTYENVRNTMNIDGNVNINVTGVGGAIGIYAKMTDLTINGNISMTKEDGYGVDGTDGNDYYGKSGIFSTSWMNNTEGANVVVNGDINLKVNGNGLFSNAGGSKISVKGGTIELKKEEGEDAAGYAAIRVEDGTVNMNVTEDADGNVTGGGDRTVKIKGNLAATTGAVNSTDIHGTHSAINLGLTTSDSTLEGIIYNAYGKDGLTEDSWGTTYDELFTGDVNLWVQNGATWTNEQYGVIAEMKNYDGDVTTPFTGSYVSNFHGGIDADHAGAIMQKDGNPLTLGNYSGYTTVIYSHTGDGTSVENYTAGDTIISKAAADSHITLSTDNTKITTSDKDQVAKVLNALAQKLTYSAYASGEKNLTGTVQIASGLTGSSQAMETGDITFTENGKGSYVGGGEPNPPAGKTEFTTAITGSADSDTEYTDAGITTDGLAYTFKNDSTITVADSTAIKLKDKMALQAEGHTLTVTTTGSGNGLTQFSGNATISAGQFAINASNDTSTVNGMQIAKGTLHITGDVSVNAEGNGGTHGIRLGNGGTLIVDGNVNMTKTNGYGVDGNDGENVLYKNGFFVQSGFMGGATSHAIVNENVNLKVNGNGVVVNMGGATFDAQGGSIELKKDDGENALGYAALRAQNGIINLNVVKDDNGNVTEADGNQVNIKGNVVLSTSAVNSMDTAGQASQINLGLTTSQSSLDGVIYNAYGKDGVVTEDDAAIHFTGAANLWLTNGAIWTNEAWGAVGESGGYGGKDFAGSYVSNFHGGTDADHAGAIMQKDGNPLTLGNYSGYTTVIYSHTGDGTAVENYTAGDTIISKAAADSHITLSTDNTKITTSDKDQVAKVLNALAQKLTYSAYASGEKNLTGTVQIASGLTGSSHALETGDITLTENGKGSYVGGGEPNPPAGKTEFTTAITGDTAADTEYAGNIQDGKYTFTADSSIKSSSGSAIDVKVPLTIDAGDHTLTLSATGGSLSGASGVISQTTAGKTAIIAGNLSIDAVDEIMYNKAGIIASSTGTEENQKAILDITGDVAIHAKSDMGDTFGIQSKGNSQVNIHGNVSMNGTNGGWGVENNMALAAKEIVALYALSEGGNDSGASIVVDGKTDIRSKGYGIAAAGYGSSVTVGGGTIETDKAASKVYYALDAESGTVNVNMNADKTAAGTTDTVILGNVAALTTGAAYGDTTKESIVNLGLSGDKSSWTGTAYTGAAADGYTGAINLYMTKGALWNNENYGKADENFQGSHVARLDSQGGVIFQKDSNPLTIDSYSGSATLIYEHKNDGTKDSDYAAGKTTITTAAKDSFITVSTDNTGIDTKDESAVAKTLSALAKKVTYGNYAAGETHLTGVVQIASGLTGSSQQLAFKDIVWDKTTGQGGIDGGELPPAPGDQKVTDFTESIDGTRQDIYVQAGVQKDDNSYVFTKDTNVTVNQVTHMELRPGSTVAGDYDVRSAVVGVNQSVKNLTIDASGKTLALKAGFDKDTTPPNQNPGILSNRSPVYGIDNSLGSAAVTVKAGTLDISVDNSYKKTNSSGNPIISEGAAYGIHAGSQSGTSAVDVTGNVNINAHGSGSVYGLMADANGTIHVKDDVTMAKEGDDWGINHIIDGKDTATNLMGYNPSVAGLAARGDKAVVTVDGKVKATSTGSGVVARAGGTVNTGEADISVRDNTGDGNYNYSLMSSFGTVNVNMNADKSGSGDKAVKLTGNIGVLNNELSQGYAGAQKSSVVNLGLSGKDSSWTGAAVNNFTADQNQEGYQGEINLYLNDGATWTNNKYGATIGDFDYGDGASYTGSHVAKLTGGADAAHAGAILQKDGKALTIDNYSGYTTVIYAHEGDGSDVSQYKAGDTIISKAAADSHITLSTDNSKIDMTSKDAVEKTLSALAQKLTYSAYTSGEKNLTGQVQIADGLTSSSVSKFVGDVKFAEDGKGQYAEGSVKPDPTPDNPDPDKPDQPDDNKGTITEGDYETFVMKGVRSAATTSLHAWRDNMNDLYETADLADEDGIFAKAYGGKTSSDVKGVHEDNTYWGGQAGYDKDLKNGWHAGVAFDYRDGDSDYLLGGKGDDKLYSFGVYGVKKLDDGSYVRLAAKAGRVENEYTVYNELRTTKLKGDYKASAYGVTAEYGKTFGTDKTYITPKAQLTWSNVGSNDYTAHTANDSMRISQDSYTSLVGRIGFEAGVKQAKGSLYASLAVAHEFDGDINARYFANDGGAKATSFDGEDTWAEFTIGGRFNLSSASQLYADFAKDFGGDFEHKWKLNAGIRFSF